MNCLHPQLMMMTMISKCNSKTHCWLSYRQR